MAAKNHLNAFLNNTVIGPSILISGRLSGDEGLTIRGRVEGDIALSHTLVVEESGIVKANVSVKNAIISGVVVGNVRATECVELTPRGRMVGDIIAPRVIVVEGASFRGRIEMGDAAVLRASEERLAAKPIPRPVAVASRFSSPLRPPSLARPLPRSADAHLPKPAAPSTHALETTPSPGPSEATQEKPLPPEPPMLMDINPKKIVVKKKN